MSRLARVAIAIAIILGGQWLASQPDIYMPIFDALREEVIMSNDAEIVEMQDDERWLVLIVEFPDDLSTDGSDHTRANAMLTGANSAATYFYEISGGQSTLIANVQSEIHTAHHNEAAYGRDVGGERDVGDESTGGPAGLVEEALTTTFSDVDMSPFDFDNDGWIDRLLILHTGGAQEDDHKPNSIWSHYAPLSAGFSVGGKSIGAYTLASFSSGVGTMIHEMLHMMGAVDLYDVHSAIPSSDWSGVGDWDIMASGNWNGHGRTPALPSSGTLNLIGANEPLDLSIGAIGPENQSFSILPHVASAGTVRLAIAPGEYIWMESRVNVGFDRDLPGHGLLVTHEDRYFADFEHNEVNRDPEHAYLKVIEGDGDGSLNSGNDGEPGDVFTSGSFGADGIQIRDGHGRLVPWTVSVDSFDNSGTDITISHPGPSHAEVLPPRVPIRLLGHETIPISFTANQDCIPWSQLTSTDERVVTLVGERMLAAGESDEFSISFSEAADPLEPTGIIEGTLGCGPGDFGVNVEIGWTIVENRLVPAQMEGQIDVSNVATLEYVLSFEGIGYSTYDLVIQGPLARVATTNLSQSLGHGSVLSLEINPNGLLSPGMIVNGKVQLYDQFGSLAGEFNVTLQAEPPGDVGSALMWLAEPANNIQLVSILLALSVISSGNKRKKKEDPGDEVQVGQPNAQIAVQSQMEHMGDPYDEFGNLRF